MATFNQWQISAVVGGHAFSPALETAVGRSEKVRDRYQGLTITAATGASSSAWHDAHIR